jgi:hypothetical protein
MRHVLILFVAVAGIAVAVPSRAQDAIDFRDDITLDDYLSSLAQIAPAARQGAEEYLAAYQLKCRRALPVVALRRAFAQGDGDQVLMGMVRATHLRDTEALARLRTQVVCGPR